MNILLLDSGGQNTLAIIRSLGKKKIFNIETVGYNKLSLANYSKYSAKKHIVPSPKDNPDLFIKAILEILSKNKYDLLMPVGYSSFKICMQYQNEIKDLTNIVLTNNNSFTIASNKTETYQLAEQLNIPYPKTYRLQNKSDITKLEPQFPVVIKAPFEMGKNVVEYAYSKEDMIKKFDALYFDYNFKEPYLPVVQDYITGDGYGFFAHYNNGVCMSQFMHKRIREYPVTGGASVCAESYYDIKLEEYGKRILDHLNWNGVAMVEFKKDIQTGEYKLMEINPKFWGSLELALVCGIEFPYYIIKQAQGEKIPINTKFPQIKFQWLLNGELYHFISRPKNGLKIIKDLFHSKKDFQILDPIPNFLQFLLIFVHYFKPKNK